MAGKFNEVLYDVMKDDMTTIKDLSFETGISEEKLRSYLYGAAPDQFDAEKIANALGVNMRTLFRNIRL